MKPAALAPATLLFAAVFGIAGCGDNNKYAAPPPPKVTVATPAEREITSYFEATGNTAAVNSVDLVARVQGFIQGISYTDGDFVKKDTLLFTIEPEPYRLKLAAAQAAEAGAQATLKQAEAEYKRQAELASKQFASQAVLDHARQRAGEPAAGAGEYEAGRDQSRLHQGDGAVRRRSECAPGVDGPTRRRQLADRARNHRANGSDLRELHRQRA